MSKPAKGSGESKMGRFLLGALRFTLSVMVGALLTLALLNFRFIVFDDGAFRVERKREWSLKGTFHWNAPAAGGGSVGSVAADPGARSPGRRSTASTRGVTRSSLPTQPPGSGPRIFQTVAASPAKASPSPSPAARSGGAREKTTPKTPAVPGLEDCLAARTRVARAVGEYNRQHQDPMTGLDLFLLIDIGALDELPACPSGGEFTQSPSGTILCSSH